VTPDPGGGEQKKKRTGKLGGDGTRGNYQKGEGNARSMLEATRSNAEPERNFRIKTVEDLIKNIRPNGVTQGSNPGGGA